jgi:activator of Hsp90 ATPase-like protein
VDVEHTGTFLELDRPRRIVFTMFVPGYSTSPDRVTVEIAAAGGGCDVTLTHDMLPDYAPFVDATVAAYTDHLNRLEAVLS